MAEENALLTPEQVAERLAVSRLTVLKWLRQGKLTGRKLGGKIWRVHPNDLQTFITTSAVEVRTAGRDL
jgi:excisionase family DNA binding protein